MKQKNNTILSKSGFISLILLFLVIFIVSVMNCLEWTMEYVYVPIALLSVIGIVILIQDK